MLWGTDSIWYGSPQDQIQAFRTFQIAPRLREQHGYAEITPALRAKIFGLNGAKVYNLSAADVKKHTARDEIAHERVAYEDRPRPAFPHLWAEDAAGVPESALVGLYNKRCDAIQPWTSISSRSGSSWQFRKS